MISIVISTHQPNYLRQLRKNIQDTIGVVFEIIAIDNNNQMGICEAYNKGASNAIYSVICFMHEDISFKTMNWGQLALKHFEQDKYIGLIGVAGATYKTAAPSSWFPWFYTNPHERIAVMNVSYPDLNKNIKRHSKNPFEETRTRVAVVDGMWLCCKREIWSRIKFDEKILKGFHCYDIDFSLAVNKYAHVAVVQDILIEHYSAGNYEKQWAEANYSLHKKWKWRLPENFSNLNEEEIYELETDARDVFIRFMYHFNITPSKILTVIWGIGSFRFFQPGRFLLWNRNWFKYVKSYNFKKES